MPCPPFNNQIQVSIIISMGREEYEQINLERIFRCAKVVERMRSSKC